MRGITAEKESEVEIDRLLTKFIKNMWLKIDILEENLLLSTNIWKRGLKIFQFVVVLVHLQVILFYKV